MLYTTIAFEQRHERSARAYNRDHPNFLQQKSNQVMCDAYSRYFAIFQIVSCWFSRSIEFDESRPKQIE